ncbi:hypothetical protein HanRHA438_Chr13g0589171 [Helianthus annuus]|nr:hypothetical protein HanRHA438_Chr13g0589171 [Helianthus annuus]
MISSSFPSYKHHHRSDSKGHIHPAIVSLHCQRHLLSLFFSFLRSLCLKKITCLIYTFDNVWMRRIIWLKSRLSLSGYIFKVHISTRESSKVFYILRRI